MSNAVEIVSPFYSQYLVNVTDETLLTYRGNKATNGAAQGHRSRKPLDNTTCLILVASKVFNHLANLKIRDKGLLKEFAMKHLKLAVHAFHSLEDPV
jgi:hypothetical protein